MSASHDSIAKERVWRNEAPRTDRTSSSSCPSILDEAIAIADGRSLLMPTTEHLQVVVRELRRHVRI
jgi:hypothetical protein